MFKFSRNGGQSPIIGRFCAFAGKTSSASGFSLQIRITRPQLYYRQQIYRYISTQKSSCQPTPFFGWFSLFCNHAMLTGQYLQTGEVLHTSALYAARMYLSTAWWTSDRLQQKLLSFSTFSNKPCTLTVTWERHMSGTWIVRWNSHFNYKITYQFVCSLWTQDQLKHLNMSPFG